MPIFGATKKVITKREHEIARNQLYAQGFSQKKLALFDALLKPHLEDAERYGDPVGVSPEEVKDLKEHLDSGDPHDIYSIDFTEPEKEAIKKVLDASLVTNK